MNVTKVDVTFEDGSIQTVSMVASAPMATPEDTEIDVVLSDGTVKKFVPAPAVAPAA